MKKPSEIYRFWNDTQELTLIIEDKDVTLPEPIEVETPTGIQLSTYKI